MSLTEFTQTILLKLDWAILFYFLFVNGFYLVLLVAATLEMRDHLHRVWGESRWRILGSEFAPTITMMAPAHNEESTVIESVRALLTLQYPNLEVMVVNDGSSDRTLEVLLGEFDMYPIHPIYRRRIETQPVEGIYRSAINPNLTVVDKKNGGKADALNVGLNVSGSTLVCAIDADTLIEPDAMLRMARPFLTEEGVVAAGATIRIANSSDVRAGRVTQTRVPKNALAGFQVGEYLRAFLFGRLGWNRLGGNLIISGAFGLFRRDEVLDAGGYLEETVGEDMELVARLRSRGYEAGGPSKVDFIPDPVAWTEAPESLRVLGRQRDRWHRGLADTMWRYRRLMFNPRYGALGMVVYPYFVLVELLAPAIELIGLAGLVIGLVIGVVNVPFAILFFLVAYGLGMVLTVCTLALEEYSYHRYERSADRGRMLLWAFLENLGYRQMTVIWRLRGLIKYLRKRREWGVMTRTGFGDTVEVEGASLVVRSAEGDVTLTPGRIEALKATKDAAPTIRAPRRNTILAPTLLVLIAVSGLFVLPRLFDGPDEDSRSRTTTPEIVSPQATNDLHPTPDHTQEPVRSLGSIPRACKRRGETRPSRVATAYRRRVAVVDTATGQRWSWPGRAPLALTPNGRCLLHLIGNTLVARALEGASKDLLRGVTDFELTGLTVKAEISSRQVIMLSGREASVLTGGQLSRKAWPRCAVTGHGMGACSPDGSYAVVSRIDGLHLVTSDGVKIANLTHTAGRWDRWPVWGPSRSGVLFVRYDGGPGEIWFIPEGSRARRLPLTLPFHPGTPPESKGILDWNLVP